MDSNSSKPQKNSKVSSKPQKIYQTMGYTSQYASNTQVSKPDEKRKQAVTLQSSFAYTEDMFKPPN